MTSILTLQLDPVSQAYFDRLREQYFPPAINYINAHVTLFHTLPDQPEILGQIEVVAQYCPFPLAVTGLRSLGKGVAYVLESETLLALHKSLAAAFAAHLTPQDRQRFQPHIVVQNKVAPETAKALLHELRSSFTPMRVKAVGLTLWHYRNGPWELDRTVPLTGR